MKKFAVFAIAAVFAASAFAAASWVGNTYIVVNGQWYNGTATGNNDWLADFGEVSEFNLGGEAQIWETGDVNWNGGAALLYYKIDNAGQWSEIELPYVRFQDNNNIMQDMTGVNIAAGLAEGQHSLSIMFGDNDHALYSAADGSATTDHASAAVFNTSFTTTTSVPEPATMSLLGLGALAMVIRRKLRK
ncbi:MAG: PEP-CTERM sorting domain-containing protein [Kiritimatiellae bacterium]|nr:PEP-CTERM sorting domain-containing protein [Kiritimatiellia bacterium]